MMRSESLLAAAVMCSSDEHGQQRGSFRLLLLVSSIAAARITWDLFHLCTNQEGEWMVCLDLD